LLEEAIPAGGLGPSEGDRLERRHLADSICFAAAWPLGTPPVTVADLGTGVGLPGIPLAILWPTTEVTLVDRSGRRVALCRRALRVLGLAHVEVLQADMEKPHRRAQMVVARAAAEPNKALAAVRAWMEPAGVGVVGGSHRTRPRPVAGEEVREIPATVLDHPAWLRIIPPQ
jgi:16S rRNA (guanine527-N7)-methyltransferase